ncbi:MAG: hypothetical protein EOP53_21410 [Sphingobacteriales bacterium]|nr:MAG: hypothetical protein EOP53_21410 [Sphingobacteriales bacterium]
MKKNLLLTIFAFLAWHIISSTDIKYRKFDNQEGPLFYMPKTEVFMVKYNDGTKETFVEKPVAPKKPMSKTSYVEPQVIKLGGPRVGVVFIGPGRTRDTIRDLWHTGPVMSQFGWGFETRLFTTKQGASGTISFLPMITGVEQGLFLPSISAMVGVRTPGGIEFGVGPNLSLRGAGLDFTAGTTLEIQGLQIPIQIHAIPSNKGFVVSFLTGFNIPKNN